MKLFSLSLCEAKINFYTNIIRSMKMSCSFDLQLGQIDMF